MRIACVYYPRLHTGCGKFHFVADAFCALGHDVTQVQTMEQLRSVDRFCDLAVFEQRGPGEICLPDLCDWLNSPRRCIASQWYFDLNVFDWLLPIEFQPPFESFVPLARAMDLVFIKERDRLDEYQTAGINAVWLDQGCPSSMKQARFNSDPDFDVILWGSSRREIWRQRYEDVSALVAEGYRVAWATTEPHLPSGVTRIPGCQPLELPRLIEQAKVTLCVDAVQSIDGYWSDRVWLAAGAGACILRRASKGGEGLPAIHYNSQLTLLNTMRQLCDDPALRERSGQMAREVTMASNLYENRCLEIISHVESHKRHEESNVPALQG